MTSIEWLIKKIESFGISTDFLNETVRQAKEMHKQEIIDCYNTSFIMRGNPFSTADKYYEDTFQKPKQ